MHGVLQTTSELLSEVRETSSMHVSNGNECSWNVSEPGAGTLQAQTVWSYERPHSAQNSWISWRLHTHSKVTQLHPDPIAVCLLHHIYFVTCITYWWPCPLFAWKWMQCFHPISCLWGDTHILIPSPHMHLLRSFFLCILVFRPHKSCIIAHRTLSFEGEVMTYSSLLSRDHFLEEKETTSALTANLRMSRSSLINLSKRLHLSTFFLEWVFSTCCG